MVEQYDPRYLQGIDYFNRRAFFHAHEVWEELWTDTQGPTRRFYQGLIQVAVCLHHFGNGNLRGRGSSTTVRPATCVPICPRHAGLDVAQSPARPRGLLCRVARQPGATSACDARTRSDSPHPTEPVTVVACAGAGRGIASDSRCVEICVQPLSVWPAGLRRGRLLPAVPSPPGPGGPHWMTSSSGSRQ